MTGTLTHSTQLNRAYVQSKVIEANLEHLRAVLSDGNIELLDTLKPMTLSFGRYVSILSEACTAADARARTTPVTAGPLS